MRSIQLDQRKYKAWIILENFKNVHKMAFDIVDRQNTSEMN